MVKNKKFYTSYLLFDKLDITRYGVMIFVDLKVYQFDIDQSGLSEYITIVTEF